MWAAGPPNWPKDGIQPLAGLVETDWLPFPFTMNWVFNRPGRIRFEQPVQRSFASETALREQYEVWLKERDSFNSRLDRNDPEAVREAWQRFYFKGEIPEDKGQAPATHINKRRLKSIRLGR